MHRARAGYGQADIPELGSGPGLCPLGLICFLLDVFVVYRSLAFMKKIIHIDMDAYFAAIEIRENPSLKGKCVIVGGSPHSRGVVSTCSYEARKYGVHSGMSSFQAWKLCPQAVFVHSSFKLYGEISKQIREIFYTWTDMVEPMSLDEAYLDVTRNKMNEVDPGKIARMIKDEVMKQTRLSCSAGVSYNKFLAKIGSDLNKPDGLSVITAENAQEILFALPVGKFHGIGKVTAARMQKMGIKTGKDLYERSLRELIRHFGKAGHFYYNVVRGVDDREVVNYWEPKSISCENTYYEDIGELDELLRRIRALAEKLSTRMYYKNIQGSNLILKIKYANFEQITRSCSLSESSADKEILYQAAEQLLISNWDPSRKVRLLGLGVGKLDCDKDCDQLELDLPDREHQNI
jgi:DNA polymerase-4